MSQDNKSSLLPDDFNVREYRLLHKDLRFMSRATLENHYLKYGKAEGRKYRLQEVLPVDFDPLVYRSLHPDLQQMNADQCIGHFIVYGQKENRIYHHPTPPPAPTPTPAPAPAPAPTPAPPVTVDEEDYVEFCRRQGWSPDNLQARIKYVRTPKHLYDFHTSRGIGFIHDRESFFRNNPNFIKSADKTKEELVDEYKQSLSVKKYLIVIYTHPLEDRKVGGYVVLHNLAKIINDLDHPLFQARLFVIGQNPYPNDFCNFFIRVQDLLPKLQQRIIAVYPETVAQNPLGARWCVRWILLALGIEMSTEHAKMNWGPHDLWRHWEPSLNPEDKNLCTPWLDPIYSTPCYEAGGHRCCFLIKKGPLWWGESWTSDLFLHPEYAHPLDGTPNDQIRDVFRECETFYCYDPNTMFLIFAVLSGCVSILVAPPGLENEDDYFRSRIFNTMETDDNNNPNVTIIARKGIVFVSHQDLPLFRVGKFNQKIQQARTDIQNGTAAADMQRIFSGRSIASTTTFLQDLKLWIQDSMNDVEEVVEDVEEVVEDVKEVENVEEDVEDGEEDVEDVKEVEEVEEVKEVEEVVEDVEEVVEDVEEVVEDVEEVVEDVEEDVEDGEEVVEDVEEVEEVKEVKEVEEVVEDGEEVEDVKEVVEDVATVNTENSTKLSTDNTTVDTVNIMDTMDTVDTVDTLETVDTENSTKLPIDDCTTIGIIDRVDTVDSVDLINIINTTEILLEDSITKKNEIVGLLDTQSSTDEIDDWAWVI